uniref:Zinc finger PMZ-type domain-containing protein n=1 Tax=Lactuca sativa TaxID=4236 RepID=A0A9R1UL87_LACSA|nr:hypothetical protein LSAT_V11C800427210 [Lactuca sativa]
MSFSKSEHEESFNNLHVYLYNLRRTNSHSYTYIKTDVMDHFQVCFVAIGCVLHAFIGCLLSVVFIGSVYLREYHLNTMFVAVAIDENNQTLPIAFGMAEENNIDCCTWFLMKLKELSFVTNIDDVFLDSYHGYTGKSVFMYMRTRVGQNKTLEPLFWMTSNSYTMFDFEQKFHGITHNALSWERTNPTYIDGALEDKGERKSLFGGKQKRSLPRFRLCSCPSFYTFFYFKTTCIVDLSRHTCSHGKWSSLGVACGHAIGVSHYSNITELVDMVHIYYQTDVFRTTYQTQNMHPLPLHLNGKYQTIDGHITNIEKHNLDVP